MARHLVLALFLLVAFSVACDASVSEVAPPPTLSSSFQLDKSALEKNATSQAAYQTAIAAKRDANNASAAATAAYNATREALAAEATIQALNAQATSNTQSMLATETVRRAQATETSEAREYTATSLALSVNATTTAIAESATETRTAREQGAKATASAANATGTSEAQDAQATRIAANATATVIAAQTQVEQARADWNRKLESFRALASFLGWSIMLLAGAAILGLLAIRLGDAVILRIRVIRDRTGVPIVVLEPDRRGRQVILAPTRSPGAALSLTPPDQQPLLIAEQAVDPGTTKRDQAISLMIAATSGQGGRDSPTVSVVGDLMNDAIQVVDEPPRHLLSAEAQTVIDADWKAVTE